MYYTLALGTKTPELPCIEVKKNAFKYLGHLTRSYNSSTAPLNKENTMCSFIKKNSIKFVKPISKYSTIMEYE